MRLSEIKTKSIVTLRQIKISSEQVRLKLYLPFKKDDPKPQILIVFVNKGSSMKSVKEFVENNYPNGYLKGKIQQLNVADDDGDIDEDFPPIALDRDISTLGVRNFYIDLGFYGDIVNEDHTLTADEFHKRYSKSNINLHDKTRISIDKKDTINDYSSSDDSDDNNGYNNSCCNCFKRRNTNTDNDNDYIELQDGLSGIPNAKMGRYHTSNNNQKRQSAIL